MVFSQPEHYKVNEKEPLNLFESSLDESSAEYKESKELNPAAFAPAGVHSSKKTNFNPPLFAWNRIDGEPVKSG